MMVKINLKKKHLFENSRLVPDASIDHKEESSNIPTTKSSSTNSTDSEQ